MRSWLDAAGVPAPAVERVALVVTELVDNAVRHAGTDIAVRAAVDGDTVLVEVADGDERLPTATRPAPDAASGRGLWLVSRIADRWGVERRPGGKAVWAAVPRGSSAPGEAGGGRQADVEGRYDHPGPSPDGNGRYSRVPVTPRWPPSMTIAPMAAGARSA